MKIRARRAHERWLLDQAKVLIATPDIRDGGFKLPPPGPARKRYYKRISKIKKWLSKQH